MGQSDLLPNYYRVSMTSRETFFANDEIENPLNLVAGRFDIAFVVTTLIPLLVIALTYNVLSEDREAGALAMLLAQPVSPRRIVVAKLAARAAAIVGLVGALVLAGLAGAGVTLTGPDGIRAIAFVALALGYTLFWLGAGIVVGAFGWPSSTNALALLGCWLVFVVLIPAMCNLVATVRYPMPSRVTLIQAARDASNDASARGSQLLGLYYQDHPELMQVQLPGADFGARTIAVQAEVDRAVRPLLWQFDRQLDRQQALVDRWQVLSPTLIAHEAFSDIAGTGIHRYRSFSRQVDALVDRLRAYFTPLIVNGAVFTSADLERVPGFAFVNDDAKGVARRGLMAAAWLSVVAAFCVGIALVPLGRPSSLVGR